MEPQSNLEPKQLDARVRWALVGLSLSMLLSSLGTSITNVALPTLAVAFGTSFQSVQWIVLAYLLAITSSIVSVGRMGDLYGRRRVLMGGLFLFTAASVLSGVSPSLGLVIAARAAQGFGAAIMMALTIAFVAEVVPKERTGSAMGLLGTTSAIGTALGPSLGGMLTAQFGWPAIFFINVPLGIFALLLVDRHLPADGDQRPTRRVGFDHAGTLLLALTLAAYSLAMTMGRGSFGLLNVGLLAAAALGASLLLVVEKRVESPLVRFAMFRDRVLSASLATNLLVSTVLMATLVVGPFYLSLALGLQAGVVGIVMSVGPLVAALTGMPAGMVVDRFGTGRTTVMALIGILVGALLLAVTPESFRILGYVAPVVVLTANYAFFQAANNTAVMRDVHPEQRGVVSGLLSLSRNLGLVTGASLMGAVFAVGSGSVDITTAAPHQIAVGMRTTFAVASGLIVMALAIALGVRGLAARPSAMMGALALALSFTVTTQATAAEPPHVAGDDQGSVRDATEKNSLRVLGLIQIQHAHDVTEGTPDTDTLLVNRARVGLLGNVYTKDLRYLLVADFGRGKVQLVFASLDYTLIPERLSVRVGQFKRPFSRSFLTSASQLMLIDRPLPVSPSAFGDTSDIGLMLHNGDSQPFEYAVGVFSGNVPGATPDGVHPLVAVRVAGNTGGLSAYSESDLEGGAPRVGVAGAAMFDFREDQSSASGLVDVLFKAYGLSLTSALYLGTQQDGPGASVPQSGSIGHYTQLGYVIENRVEPVVRYSLLMPRGDSPQHDLTGGINLYLHGNTLKLQSDVSVRFNVRDGQTVKDVSLETQVSLAF